VTLAGIAETRAEVVRRCDLSGSQRRTALTEVTDEWLQEIFRNANAQAEIPCTLIALGSHGRRELAPGSDLDLLLLHRANQQQVSGVADALWYPIWDAGLALDHSVRTLGEARTLASDDVKVMLGLLDARVIAGDPTLAEHLREAAFADWRAMSAKRLPQLKQLVDARRQRFGDLTHVLEPDLKESYGGLRDVTVLRGIAASWITDIPHTNWPQANSFLLDVRDALHRSTGSRSDRLMLQEQEVVARELGLVDADALLRAVYEAARSISYASDQAWYRAMRLTWKPQQVSFRPVRSRRPERLPLADGVVVHEGEVVLAADARPDRDPTLIVRAAAAAAQAGLPLSHHTVDRLAAESAPMPNPWPKAARDALISLLGSGASVLAVWEALDQVGIIEEWIPGWAVVRSAPQRNPIHRFTVDRHLIETAVQASAITRWVRRPDLLLIGALLHDIGKAQPGDHSIVGARIASEIAPRLGFTPEETAVITDLVRFHLLLPDVATKRDLDDPRTAQDVVALVPDPATIELLGALSHADACATGPAVSSTWRLGLISTLVRTCLGTLAGDVAAEPEPLTAEEEVALQAPGVWVLMRSQEDGCEIAVAAPDAPGLLATVAAVLAVHRLQIRGARVRTVGGRALQTWNATPQFGEPPSAEQMSEGIRRAIDGSYHPEAMLRERASNTPAASITAFPEPRVWVLSEPEARHTIVEVRAHDRPGLLFAIASAITHTNAQIHGAKVDTLGADVVDVFFITNGRGEVLDDAAAGELRANLLQVLAEIE